jgi:NADH-quinone oxidoreductase subunit C
MSDPVTDEAGVEDEATDEGEAVPASPWAGLGVPLLQQRGEETLHPTREQLVDLVRDLRDDHGFQICADLTAVDYLAHRAPRALPPEVTPERFEVVVTLLSLTRRQRLRLRVQVPAGDPTCPSLFDVHPGTESFEREVFDLFGIRFEGHPDLSRILMPEDWEGHPLRKDYPIGAIPVQFKGVADAR